MDLKQDLVANLSDVSSLRDFGGCYIVEGRYLLEPAKAIGAKFVSMVDHGDTSAYQARAEEAALLLPDTRFETVNADFRHAATFTGLEPVDASILFEVLTAPGELQRSRPQCDEHFEQVCLCRTAVPARRVVPAPLELHAAPVLGRGTEGRNQT